MKKKVIQRANYLFNAKTIFLSLEGENGLNLVIPKKTKWSNNLGRMYHQFSYTNDPIELIGREQEKEELEAFLDGNTNFKVTAITGQAGNGKSRLVYEVFKDKAEQENWKIFGLAPNELQFFKTEFIYYFFPEDDLEKNILFVIDYVTVKAFEIGNWIQLLYNNMKEIGSNIKIRIILVERAQVTQERKPYWYTMLVEKHGLMEEGLCEWEKHIKINNLPEDKLEEIFVKYIENKAETYEKLYGTKPDISMCKKEANVIINKLDEKSKRPLYIKYIADAWLNDKSKKGRNWSKEAALQYVVEKENKKISAFFEKEKAKEIALKKILAFSMAINGIELGEHIPHFLMKEFELIEESFINGSPTMKQFLIEVGELEKSEQYILKSGLPEVVEEYYFLKYLDTQIEIDWDNKTCVEEFVNQGWKTSPSAFACFLCRLVEDFSEHPLVNFEGILKLPQELSCECAILYADVLREYTFWVDDIAKYKNSVPVIYEEILGKTVDSGVLHKVCKNYAVALFNMIWWCSKKSDSDDFEGSYAGLFLERLKNLSNSMVELKEIYLNAQKLFE